MTTILCYTKDENDNLLPLVEKEVFLSDGTYGPIVHIGCGHISYYVDSLTENVLKREQGGIKTNELCIDLMGRNFRVSTSVYVSLDDLFSIIDFLREQKS